MLKLLGEKKKKIMPWYVSIGAFKCFWLWPSLSLTDRKEAAFSATFAMKIFLIYV